ncbi:MAG: cytochrome c [Bryobacteraceae bacterium]|nr:cytochrome c [Bryobacteraceae bacterium]
MRAASMATLALLLLAGCGTTTRKPPIEIFPDMDRQPRYNALAESPFFPDGRASRMPVPGTVAVGQLREDDSYYTGISGNLYLGRNPRPLDAALLARGRTQFEVYCAPCHDRAGDGRGIVSTRAGWLAVNLHEERVVQMTDGELFNVATFGRRTMPGYRFQIPADDRWAIVAYIRALQRTTQGTLVDVPPELRKGVR